MKFTNLIIHNFKENCQVILKTSFPFIFNNFNGDIIIAQSFLSIPAV